MGCNVTHQFHLDLEEALQYYMEIDHDLASGLLDEIEQMEII